MNWVLSLLPRRSWCLSTSSSLTLPEGYANVLLNALGCSFKKKRCTGSLADASNSFSRCLVGSCFKASLRSFSGDSVSLCNPRLTPAWSDRDLWGAHHLLQVFLLFLLLKFNQKLLQAIAHTADYTAAFKQTKWQECLMLIKREKQIYLTSCRNTQWFVLILLEWS